MTSGALVLADGETFAGTVVGASDTIGIGEVVFNTAMSGYQEIATDPSYAGQIVAMTASHIGNYGTNDEDAQADRAWCTGFVTRSLSRRDSSWRSEGSFTTWLRDRGVVGLTDVDTRRLTRYLRDRGAMPGAIGARPTDELQAVARAAPTMDGRDLTGAVTTQSRYRVEPRGAACGRVVAIDLGLKRDIFTALTQRGLEVDVVPANTSADDILSLDPAGVFLSNGPGDPEPVSTARTTVETLLGRIPIFGICLGHQILGLALGAQTYKLPFGHHGGNHPVRRLTDGRVAITAQNHGFAVDLWSMVDAVRPDVRGLPGPDLLPTSVDTRFGPVIPTHQNLNDGTLEGLAAPDALAFSVQYHPEAAPGPNDALDLFDRFVELMEVS